MKPLFPRKSLNPQKQLMFFYLYFSMKKSRNLQLGLDLAAGDLANMNYFQTRSYFAVEKHLTNIYSNLKKSFTEFKIIEADINYYFIFNDFSVCTETIAINNLYELQPNLNFLYNILNNIRDKGYLVINFGNKNSFLDKNFEKIDQIFSQHLILNRVIYGNFNKIESSYLSSVLKAILMLLIPSLRISENNKDKKVFYFLKIRNDEQ